MFERMKRKETKNEKEKYSETQRCENIEDNMFVLLEYFKNKVKKKENPWLLTTNDSTNMLTS